LYTGRDSGRSTQKPPFKGKARKRSPVRNVSYCGKSGHNWIIAWGEIP